MLNIKRCFSNLRLMKALTGVTIKEFHKLLEPFALELERHKSSKKKGRKRQEGAGRHHTLETPTEKLFFILFYVKCYPTFDVLGFIFNVDRSQPCRWVQEYLPVLEAALGREVVLPVRKICSVEEFVALFPEIKMVFVDGTERPIQRPQDKGKQKANYSGKKKRHTKKNIVITDEDKRVLFLSDTQEGKQHDKAVANEAEVFQHIPEDVKVQVDLGFQGVQKENPELTIIIPKKKPPKKELSEGDKENNRQKAKERVKVEHALGGVKRLRSVTDVFRNRKQAMEDHLMVVACGLWNYHLKLVA